MGRERKGKAVGKKEIFLSFPTALLEKFDAELDATTPKTTRQALFVHIFEAWLDADEAGRAAPLPPAEKRLNWFADCKYWTLQIPLELLARLDAKALARRPEASKFARRHFICEVLEQRYNAQGLSAAVARTVAAPMRAGE